MAIAIITGQIMLGTAIVGGGTFLLGSVLAYFLYSLILRKKSEKILREAETEAEVIKKDKILQAKEKFLQLKSEHDRLINDRNSKLGQAESKFKQKELAISQKFEEVQRSKNE